MASPVVPSSGPPPPPRRAQAASGEVSVGAETAQSGVAEPPPDPPDSDAAPTIARNPLPSFDGVPDPAPTATAGADPARIAKTDPPAASAAARARSELPTSTARAGVGRRLERAAAAAGAHVKAAYGGVCAFIDARRDHLPRVLRDRVSAPVLLAVGSLAAAAIVGGTIGLMTMPASQELVGNHRKPVRVAVNAAAAPRSTTTTRPGPAALATVAPTVPDVRSSPAEFDEPSLLLGLASRFTTEGREAEAVALVERVLLRKPELRADPRVVAVLIRTAQAENKAAASATFALLSGPMAEHGARALYDLWLSPTVKEEPKRRAEKWLQSKDFDKVAALPLYVSVKLRQAKTCEDKHALLALASAGDRQTLEYLREIEKRTTCAPDDLANCYPCMRADGRLVEAIGKLQERVEG